MAKIARLEPDSLLTTSLTAARKRALLNGLRQTPGGIDCDTWPRLARWTRRDFQQTAEALVEAGSARVTTRGERVLLRLARQGAQ